LKALVIINPNAGNGELIKNTSWIIKRFNDRGIETDVMLTSKRGDATEYIKKYAEGRKLVICAGGDGTLNEAVNGVMSFEAKKRPDIGYIPCGTTNDFAKSLKIPLDINNAVNSIIGGKPVPYDIGSINNRYFTYVAAGGAFSSCSYATSQDMKRILGHTAYVLEGIKEIPAIKAHHMKFEFDSGNTLEGDYAFVAVSNSKSYGGIINLDKLGVDTADGLFEMTLVKLPKNILEVGKIAISLSSGDYDKSVIDFVRFSSCRMTVEPNELNWTIDGEKGDLSGTVDIKNDHNAVRFVVKEMKYDIPTDIPD